MEDLMGLNVPQRSRLQGSGSMLGVPRLPRGRRALCMMLLLGVGLAAWGVGGTQAAMAANGPQTATFGCLAVSQYLNVPTGVTQMTVHLEGAAGEGGTGNGSGGLGATLDGTLSVTPGDTLRVDVGCQSGYGYPTGAAGGGGNGLAN
jgi:hypothetical protein